MLPSEEIKAKLDIVDLIREYLPLRAAGTNFQALCPFHSEKSPSFLVSPDKQIWHCFGCSRGGDIFSFIMEKEGLSFPEAVRFLAPKAGVNIGSYDRQEYSRRNRLLDILDLAKKYYQYKLKNTEGGKKMFAYLRERGLKDETIEDWQIGYSEGGWDGLLNFFLDRAKQGKEKYQPEELFSAGLLIKKDGNRGYYDRFRNRIMFPIKDVSGNTIGFSGRIDPGSAEAERQGKYINSPQTEVYDKSRAIFGIDKAKAAIRSTGQAIIVEGQMDVIACHQAGFENVVASSGTALTLPQLEMIKRFAPEVVLAFDMDSAGQMAASRGIGEALSAGFKVSVLQLPYGKDPADSLRSETDSFRFALEHTVSVLDYMYGRAKEGKDMSRSEDKRAVVEAMAAVLGEIKSPIEQSMWIRKLSEELGFDEVKLREDIGRQATGRRVEAAEGREERQTGSSATRQEKLFDSFLAILLRFPELMDFALANFLPDEGQDGPQVSLYRRLALEYGKGTPLSFPALSEAWAGDEEALKRLETLSLLGERDFYSLEPLQAKGEMIKMMVELKQGLLRARIAALQAQIAQAEREGEDDLDLDLLMEQLKGLTDELKSIKLA